MMRLISAAAALMAAVPSLSIAQIPANQVEALMRQAMPADAECWRNPNGSYCKSKKDGVELLLEIQRDIPDISIFMFNGGTITGPMLDSITDRVAIVFVPYGFSINDLKDCVAKGVDDKDPVLRSGKEYVKKTPEWILKCFGHRDKNSRIDIMIHRNDAF